jgi:hypothetical protein
MTTTTQAAGVPDGAFAIAPDGRGLVVPQGRSVAVPQARSLTVPQGRGLTVPQGRNAPPIPQGRPSPASAATNSAVAVRPASAALPTLSLSWIDVTERAADAWPRRLPLPLSDRLHRFIPE